MTAIWLLPTKGRPQMCQQALDACTATGMTSPGVVYVDETVDEYQNIVLPANWTIHYAKRWGGIGAAMRWAFKKWPNATQYGWLADDTFPRTNQWDRQLEKAAGAWRLVYGVDRYISANRSLADSLDRGSDLGAPLCWGGELVRTVGWWALPGVKQAGIDTAWVALVQPLRLFHYVRHVHADHDNYRTGRRPKDHTDSWERNGVNFIEKDICVRNRWVASPDFAETLERLRVTAGVWPRKRRQR